jgi:HEPN domain-containing protein/predicted nucleotidyltransferase
MIQRAQSSGRHAEAIAARIASAVRPWRIVLFGSRARGDASDESDCDVYVEVDQPRELLGETERRIRTLFVGPGWRLDLTVRGRGEIERRSRDPGTIEWDVARERRLLYADDAAPALPSTDTRVREPQPVPPESAAEWLETARNDLRLVARLLELNEGFAAPVCFHAHQGSEKYMKALLVARHVRPPRTHHLPDLLAALRADGCALPGLDDDCALLTTHAIVQRYPPGLGLGASDARLAADAAERIVGALRRYVA